MTVSNVFSCCIRCPGQYGRAIHMLCTVKGTPPYKWRFRIYLHCRVRAVIIVPFINASVRLHSLHNNWNRNLNSFSSAIYLVGQKKLLVVRFKEILWFFFPFILWKRRKVSYDIIPVYACSMLPCIYKYYSIQSKNVWAITEHVIYYRIQR